MILNYALNQPIAKVFECLSNMQKFCSVHPVIYKVDTLDNNEYKFYEKYAGVSFSYCVSVTETMPLTYIAMYSKVQPGVYLNLYFRLKTENGITYVEEEVDVKAPIIIKQVFERVLKKAHQKMFANIGCM